MYQGVKARVVFNGEHSEFFYCNNGLKQGENLSPFLFSLYLNDLEDNLLQNNIEGVKCVNNNAVNNLGMYFKILLLLYADDTILCSDSPTDLQLQLNAFADYCNTWKLKVNISKTKAMTFSRTNTELNFKYNGHNIENVNVFNYLGLFFF